MSATQDELLTFPMSTKKPLLASELAVQETGLRELRVGGLGNRVRGSKRRWGGCSNVRHFQDGQDVPPLSTRALGAWEGTCD